MRVDTTVRKASGPCVFVAVLAAAAVGHEQRGGGLHRPEAGLRPVLQPLVRREVPEGGPQRRPVHRDLPEVPAVRAEGHQGEGDPDRRGRVHGTQQGQTRELMDGKPEPITENVINILNKCPRGPLSMRRSRQQHSGSTDETEAAFVLVQEKTRQMESLTAELAPECDGSFFIFISAAFIFREGLVCPGDHGLELKL